ncbi:MAG: NADH-quinone oxidoreductase subunit NuoE [Promethearchaeota archaeon]
MDNAKEPDVKARLRAVLSAAPRRSSVVALLQGIQEEFGYVPREAVVALARQLGSSPAEVYGVATFYSQFRFEPPGRHEVKVCRGTACHVAGSSDLLEALEERYDVRAGHASKDGKFSLEGVYCLGCCALAPVVELDGEVLGKASRREVFRALDALE